MIIQYIKNRISDSSLKDGYLTLNKNYLVYGLYFDMQINIEFSVLDDQMDGLVLLESKLCSILDNRIPPDWVCEFSDDKQVCQLYPKEFVEPIEIEKFGEIQVSGSDPVKKEYWERVFSVESTDFWERYHDGCPLAEEVFAKVTKKLKQFHGIKD